MYDQEDCRNQKADAPQPACRDKLFPEHHDGRPVKCKQKQRVDTITRQSHEERRDRKSDFTEDILTGDGDE